MAPSVVQSISSSKENKGEFRRFIIQHFNNNNYKDNGLLNLRFLINCKGEIGDIEINELNFDFEPIALTDSLVQELMELAFLKDNWDVSRLRLIEPNDYYMYLIFRIENGQMVDILP